MSALASEVGVRLDPLKSYNFLVMLVDSGGPSPLGAVTALLSSVIGGFTECSGLEATMETEEYRQGGQNDAVLHFPTRATFETIRLRHGVGLMDDLWNWHRGFVTGAGKRKDGVILLQNDLQIPVKAWSFRRGIPVKWTGPALDAGQNRVAIEEIAIQHEGLDLASLGTGVQAAKNALGVG
jgi:phage tail-like protein